MALLDIHNLCVDIQTEQGLIRMIDHFSLKVEVGEICALMGESGSGKSIITKIICNEAQDNWIIYADRFRFNDIELLKLTPAKRAKLIGRNISRVSQASMQTLDPTRTIGQQFKQHIASYTFKGRWWRYIGWKKRRMIELLHRVGITEHKDVMNSYPAEITEGQQQKVLIAMAIANQPVLLVADEPTNALESLTKIQIFRLLASMNENLNTTILLASNDVQYLKTYCDTLSILYCGQNVESGKVDLLLKNAHHPYTYAILHAIPDFSQPIPLKSRIGTLKGTVPMLDELPIGCRLGPRCPFSQKQCIQKPLTTKIKQQEFACHFPLNWQSHTIKTSPSPLTIKVEKTDNL